MLDTPDMHTPVQLASFADPPSAELSVWLQSDGERSVVHLGGELDVTGRGVVLLTCAAVDNRVVTVDLAHVTFMDCAGYSGLVAARHVLEARGGSLTLADITGQPCRLLTLIDGPVDGRHVTRADRKAPCLATSGARP